MRGPSNWKQFAGVPLIGNETTFWRHLSCFALFLNMGNIHMHVLTYFCSSMQPRIWIFVQNFVSEISCIYFGTVFLFYKYIAYLKNPADRPMTFMSWFYSDQSTPTYYSFTILSLSVLATFYENRASELTCCGNTTFPNITWISKKKWFVSLRKEIDLGLLKPLRRRWRNRSVNCGFRSSPELSNLQTSV